MNHLLMTTNLRWVEARDGECCSVQGVVLQRFFGRLVFHNCGRSGTVETVVIVDPSSLGTVSWRIELPKIIRRRLLENEFYSSVACLRLRSASVLPSRCMSSTMRLSRKTMQLFSKMLPSGVKGSPTPMICLVR